MSLLATPHTVLSVDIVGSSAGDRARQRHLDNGQDSVFKRARAEAAKHVDVDSWFMRVTGDGMTAAIPSVAKAWIVAEFVRLLEIELLQFNRHLSPEHRLRVRAALADGEVIVENNHISGKPVAEAARILEADALRTLMRENPDVPLGLIVTDRFYHDVIKEGELDLSRVPFTAVTVQVKDFRDRAWLRAATPQARATIEEPAAPKTPPQPTIIVNHGNNSLNSGGNVIAHRDINIGR